MRVCRVLKVREYSHGNGTHTHTCTQGRATWGWWGKGRPINIYWHSRSGEGSATFENKRQRMRSGVPGNLSAEGPAPRLCSKGKQEEDAGDGGTEAGREGRPRLNTFGFGFCSTSCIFFFKFSLFGVEWDDYCSHIYGHKRIWDPNGNPTHPESV